jgi:predicted ATPase
VRILELKAEGFRSLKEVTWKPGNLNVIIGPNATGKSNLLSYLETIRASADGKMSEFIMRLGGMGPLVWDGKADGIKSSVTCQLPADLQDELWQNLTYVLELKRVGQTGHYFIQSELVQGGPSARADDTPGEPLIVRNKGKSARLLDLRTKRLEKIDEAIPDDETLLSAVRSPLTKNKLISEFRSRIADWQIFNEISVGRSAALRQATISRYERKLAPDGQNLVNALHTLYSEDRGFKDEVDAAMAAAFTNDFVGLVFAPAADQQIQLRIRWKSLNREQSAAHLSDGTLRFLFLVAVLAHPDPGPLIAIDEPETGLHPSMFPIVAEHAVAASAKTQVIFTTHSPQFLDGFRETVPTTTITLWEDGQTILKTLEGDMLKEWLKGYSLGKLFTSGELEAMG